VSSRNLDDELAAIARGNERRRLVLTAVIVLLAAAAVVTSLRGAAGGSLPALARLALGAYGVVAGLILWRAPRRGWPLALGWAILQIPYVAWSPDGGSPTTQTVDFPVTWTDSSTINGRLVSYLSVGVNVVGVALTGWLVHWRDYFRR
jgi:hypothetical protein